MAHVKNDHNALTVDQWTALVGRLTEPTKPRRVLESRKADVGGAAYAPDGKDAIAKKQALAEKNLKSSVVEFISKADASEEAVDEEEEAEDASKLLHNSSANGRPAQLSGNQLRSAKCGTATIQITAFAEDCSFINVDQANVTECPKYWWRVALSAEDPSCWICNGPPKSGPKGSKCTDKSSCDCPPK